MQVLVAEDDEHVNEMLVYRLETAGYDVVSFQDGEECWEFLTDVDEPPDALLLDVMMPGMDGLDVLRRLREYDFDPEPAVIIVSGRGLEQDVLTGFDLGADDYVTKPFSPSEVVARLRRILE
ncbi:response regulator receiver protein [Natrialba chahannaoensis JCM 10990]|uniref:Response regulator receiver protein n=1 Tax=Natrialba chahannaoensis JCM 10990 TaxID=1227492 RepID=M0ALJ2_9EURY|nr:response regulator transcription factor [Natrialba chahannaoensis]ELY98248.1 response regulator receiver protein [Natrialba chahannaoensis JCM 10990]